LLGSWTSDNIIRVITRTDFAGHQHWFCFVFSVYRYAPRITTITIAAWFTLQPCYWFATYRYAGFIW
jgi:hypothetical protein